MSATPKLVAEPFVHEPHDIEVEQALLGALLAHPRSLERLGLIQPHFFFDPLHGRLFLQVRRMAAAGKSISAVTLHAAMKADPGLIEMGGMGYLETLRRAAPAIPNIPDYANILGDLTLRRSLVHAGEDLIRSAFVPPEESSTDTIAAEASALIQAVGVSARAMASRPDLVLKVGDWLRRDLPEPDFLLGQWLSTTSRMMLVGPTGLGKTNLCVAVAMGMASGDGFLHWPGQRPARVLFVDGEMSSRLFRTRLGDAARRLGGKPDTFFALNRDDAGEALLPLNTAAGQAFMDSVIEKTKAEFVWFDNIQALIPGDMKDEEPWQQALPWIRRLTQRGIGQAWVHHTGHNTTRSYGTSTREWQLDTVVLLEAADRPGADVAFSLKFTKARERAPHNRTDFEPAVITLQDDQWQVEANVIPSASRKPVRGAARVALELMDKALAEAGDAAPTTPHIPSNARTIRLSQWRKYADAGLVPDSDNPDSKRKAFVRATAKLQALGLISIWGEFAWRK